MRAFLALAAIASSAAGVVLHKAAPESAGDQVKLAALQPILDKLSNLDPKVFNLVNGLLSQAEAHGSNNAAPPRLAGSGAHSFLQYFRERPEDVEEKLQRLAPLLERLKGLDPQAFGSLNNLVNQAEPVSTMDANTTATVPARAVALMQRDTPASDDPENEKKMEALQPILDKLKGLDGKAFAVLSSVIAQASGHSQHHD
mmetsp:Transcript_16038/g.43994  ORF Transcript_16038/g.43994 Transcript_16038/m.43994 type:complete len:200 (-) Transcript_16038:260-859(-)